MTGQGGSEGAHPHYSPDGRRYWDGTRWLEVPPGFGGEAPASVPAKGPGRRRLAGLSTLLVALVVVASVGSVAGVVLDRDRTGLGPRPSAQAIFDLPYTRGVGSAVFHSVTPPGGSPWITDGAASDWKGSGVIELAPVHAFSESLATYAGIVFQRNLAAGGMAYQSPSRTAPFQATDSEPGDFRALGWDGEPAPNSLRVAGQTTVAGQLGWVLVQAYTQNRWVVAERTGDPLRAVVAGTTYTFGDWGRAIAVRAPAARQVSPAPASGGAGAPVAAPGATVGVLREQVDPAAADGDPPGFRTVALEISYDNTSSTWTDFDNDVSLVSSGGVFATSTYTSLSPWLRPQTVTTGETIEGWEGFIVPRAATSFRFLFGEPGDEGLISISVSIPR